MDQLHSTTLSPDRERGQHLKFEDRCSIQVYKRLGYSLRNIAKALNCSPSTVMYELRRGTPSRKGSRGRLPEYSAKRGQECYQLNRSLCHRKVKALKGNPFVDWVIRQIRNQHWSLDACVGHAREHALFLPEQLVCTKTLYNAIWSGQIEISLFDLPEALQRRTRKHRSIRNRKILGKNIDERSEEASARTVEGHWEIDTVVGHKAGQEAVVLTLVEKKTDYYLAIKIPGKTPEAVNAAMEVLHEEYSEHFSEVFKTITADNGAEFAALSELEKYGVKIYFAHPYSSWERPQNERHNRILRRYVPKGKSVEKYSAEQITDFADLINSLPRRQLDYRTPEELFEAFLDQVYSVVKVQFA